MARETNPNYAANRAWAVAESMVKSIRKYLESPRDFHDQASDLQSLVDEADSVLDGLHAVRKLLTSREADLPDGSVLEAIKRSIDFEVDVVVGTEIKKYDNPEVEKLEIVGLLSVARSGRNGTAD